MSCGCHTTPCICQQCSTEPCPGLIPYTFENVNDFGEGVLAEVSGTVVSFRGIQSSDSSISVVLDEASNTIDITTTGGSGDIPQATETVLGGGEIATNAEMVSGTSDTKIVTPLKLANLASSETQSGILKIATSGDIATGTNNTKAVSPLGLAGVIDSLSGTQSVADATARASTTPDFQGQLLLQQDEGSLWYAPSTTPGNWDNSFVFNQITATTGNIVSIPGLGGNPPDFPNGSTSQGDLVFTSPGIGIQLSDAANGKIGIVTLVAGQSTVNNTSVHSDSIILVTRIDINGSSAIGHLVAAGIVDGVSFVVNSIRINTTIESGDVSIYNYLIIDPSP